MTADTFRGLYDAARANGYRDTRVAFCAMILRVRGLATKRAVDAAVAWLNDTDAALTHTPKSAG